MSKTIKTGLSESEKEVRMIITHIMMIAIYLDLELILSGLFVRNLPVNLWFVNLLYSFGELLI